MFRYFILLLQFYPAFHSAQIEQAFQVDHPERLKQIREILDTTDRFKDSLAFVNLISTLKTLAVKVDDEQSLLLGQLYELPVLKQNSETILEKTIATIQRIILQAKEKNYTIIQIQALLSMGDILIFNSRTGAAISYYLRVYELAKGIPPVYLPRPLFGLDGYIGTTFYVYGDYEKAKFYIQRCITGDTGYVKPHTQIVRLDLLSQICLKNGEFDQSEFYIREAMKIRDQAEPGTWWVKPWEGIFIGNLAKILYFKNEVQHAIPGLEKAVKLTHESELHDNVSTFGLLLLDCYLRIGRNEQALTLLPLVQQAVYAQGNDVNHRDLFRVLSLIPVTGYSLERKQQILDSLDYWNQKLVQRKNTDQQMQKELAAEMELWKQKEENLKSNITHQLLLKKILLIVLAFLSVLAVIIIYFKQSQIDKQKKYAVEFTEKSTQAFAKAQEELDTFKKLLVEKNKQIELLEEIKDAAFSSSDLESLKEKSILTDDDWLHFKKLFEKAHPGFLNSVSLKFAGLSPGEMRFIMMIKLSLNNKEMASSLGVSTGAIRTMRSRLLKKLALNEEDSIEKKIAEL